MPFKRQRRELTDFQKGQIEGRRYTLSHAEIGRELNIPRWTVSSFLTRLDNRQTPTNLPRPGAPRKTSASDDRYIVHAAETNTHQPL